MNETSEQYDLRKYVNHLEAHARKLERKLLKARLHVENVEQAVTRRNERIAELEGALRSKREKTSAELIELAWERAHPVPAGEALPAGTRYMRRIPGDNSETDHPIAFFTRGGITATQLDREYRTLEPLTPEWQKAPVIVAHTAGNPARRPFIHLDSDEWIDSHDDAASAQSLIDPVPVKLPEEEQK